MDHDFPNGYDQLVPGPDGALVGLRWNDEGFERLLTDEETEELVERQRQEAMDALQDDPAFDPGEDEEAPAFLRSLFQRLANAAQEPDERFAAITVDSEVRFVIFQDRGFVSLDWLGDTFDTAYDNTSHNQEYLERKGAHTAAVEMHGRAQMAAELSALVNAEARAAGKQLADEVGG